MFFLDFFRVMVDKVGKFFNYKLLIVNYKWFF